MRIGILGGTCLLGKGLALRLALKHDILLGSRSEAKAKTVAGDLSRLAKGYFQSQLKGTIEGTVNADLFRDTQVIIIALPPRAIPDYLRQFRQKCRSDHIIVSTVVPMVRRNNLYEWHGLSNPPEGAGLSTSAAETIQALVAPTPVVSAFQTIPAKFLINLDSVLNIDVFVAGDDELALCQVSRLIRNIPNLRPLRVGPLQNSKWIEAITPLLLNAAKLNGLHDPSIRIIPWMPT